MKTKVLSIFLTLLLASIFSSSNAFAQGAPQWHLPEGAIARLGNGIIHQIAYSPDGSQIAVASSIGIWLYDVDTGIAVTLLEGSNVACIAYSPDGKTIAGCGSFPERRPWGETIMLDTVRLWNVEDGTIQQTLPHTTAGYVDLAWSPDGKTIAVSAAFDPVRLWNIEEGVFKIEFPADTEGVRSIAYHPSGSTIATMNSRDDSVDLYLWDTEKGIYIKTFAENVVGISSMAYSPDGKTIVTGSWNDVHIWDANTGEEKKSGLTTDWGGKQVKCSTVPMVLLSLLSVVHGYISGIPARIPKKEASSTVLDTGSRIISFAYSPDGKTIATATADLTVRLWDATPEPFGVITDTPKATLAKHTGPVSSVAYSPDGTTIVTGSNYSDYWNPFLYFWDAGTGTLKKTVDHTWPVADIAYSPSGDIIATAGGFEGVRLWDAETGTRIASLDEHDGSPEYRIADIAYSPDGSTLAVSVNNTVSLWQVSESRVRKRLTGHTLRINSVAYSPDSLTLATGGADAIVHLWSDVNGLLLDTLEGHRTTVNSIAYSPDGNTIATGGDDYNEEVRLWDADTGTPIGTLDTGGIVNSVAYSPDGNTLATGRWDVHLWSAHTSALEKTFRGHAGVVWQVAYSPDGSVLASASEDGTVLLWGLTLSAIGAPNINEVHVKADVNGDGIVNIQDLVLVSANFGLTGQHPADVNGDGVVNIQDLVAVAAAF